jgi:hypothetical protein
MGPISTGVARFDPPSRGLLREAGPPPVRAADLTSLAAFDQREPIHLDLFDQLKSAAGPCPPYFHLRLGP